MKLFFACIAKAIEAKNGKTRLNGTGMSGREMQNS